MSRGGVVALALFLSSAFPVEGQDAFSRFLELRSEHKYADAERVLLDAWKRAELSSAKSATAADFCHQLGKFYYERGRYFDAERFFKRALAIWDENQPAQAEKQASTVNCLAVVYLNEARFELVEPLYAKYRSAWLTSLEPDNVEIARSLNNLGFLHYRRGDMVRAEALYLKALALSDRVTALNNLGVVYSETGRLDKALECFTEVIALEAKRPQSNVLVSVGANLNVGAVHCLAKRCDEALKFYDKALQDALRVLGPEHPLPATVAARYAEALRTLKHKDEAKRMEKLARQLHKDNHDQARARLTVDVSELQRKSRR